MKNIHTSIPKRAARRRQTPLNIAIITDQSALYAPLFIHNLCTQMPQLSPSIYVRVAENFGKPNRRTILNAGPRYLTDRTVSILKLRVLNIWNSSFHGTSISELPSPSLDMVMRHNVMDIYEFRDAHKQEFIEKLVRSGHEVILTVFFGQILREGFLNRFENTLIINLHPSLLPRYAGVNPIFWAMANGEPETGATAHLVEKGVDSGAILRQLKEPIHSSDTHHSLYRRVVTKSATMCSKILKDLEATGYHSIREQDTDSRTYFSQPTPESYSDFRSRGWKFS